jgi:hypothetical protein
MVEAVSNSPYWKEKSKSLALAMGMMRARFQRAQVKRIIPALPAIESLAAGGAICSCSLGLRQLSALSVSRQQDDL